MFAGNHINGNLYAYAANNPVKYTDPDGRNNNDALEKIEKLGSSMQSFKALSKEQIEGYVLKKWNFVGEKPNSGNPNFSADTPEKQVKEFASNPEFEIKIEQMEFPYMHNVTYDEATGVSDPTAKNIEEKTEGYMYKFSFENYAIYYYDFNDDGWIDFVREE